MDITPSSLANAFFREITGDRTPIAYGHGLEGSDYALAEAADQEGVGAQRGDGETTFTELTAFISRHFDANGSPGLQPTEFAAFQLTMKMADSSAESATRRAAESAALRAQYAAHPPLITPGPVPSQPVSGFTSAIFARNDVGTSSSIQYDKVPMEVGDRGLAAAADFLAAPSRGRGDGELTRPELTTFVGRHFDTDGTPGLSVVERVRLERAIDPGRPN